MQPSMLFEYLDDYRQRIRHQHGNFPIAAPPMMISSLGCISTFRFPFSTSGKPADDSAENH